MALLLLMVIALPASAEVVPGASVPTARMTWEEFVGTCTLTMSIPGSAYWKSVPIEDASEVAINNGEQAVITWPAGNCATQEPSHSPNSNYSLYQIRLESLAVELGYEIESMSSAAPTFEFYVVPSGLPAGRYSFGVECKVIDAEWSFSRWQSGIVRAITPPTYGDDSGEIYGIPIQQTAPKLIVITLG